MTHHHIVILSWPGEPDRGPEVVGPFATEHDRSEWAAEALAALPGVYVNESYMTTPWKVEPPTPGTPASLAWGKVIFDRLSTDDLIAQRELSLRAWHDADNEQSKLIAQGEVTAAVELLMERGVPQERCRSCQMFRPFHWSTCYQDEGLLPTDGSYLWEKALP